jgi:hypothetical protein
LVCDVGAGWPVAVEVVKASSEKNCKPDLQIFSLEVVGVSVATA